MCAPLYYRVSIIIAILFYNYSLIEKGAGGMDITVDHPVLLQGWSAKLDYRYNWLRDTAFTVQALYHLETRLG